MIKIINCVQRKKVNATGNRQTQTFTVLIRCDLCLFAFMWSNTEGNLLCMLKLLNILQFKSKKSVKGWQKMKKTVNLERLPVHYSSTYKHKESYIHTLTLKRNWERPRKLDMHGFGLSKLGKKDLDDCCGWFLTEPQNNLLCILQDCSVRLCILSSFNIDQFSQSQPSILTSISPGLYIPLILHRPTHHWAACWRTCWIGRDGRNTSTTRVWSVIDCGTLLPKGACSARLCMFNQCKSVQPGNLCPPWWSAFPDCTALICRGYDVVNDIIFSHQEVIPDYFVQCFSCYL